MIRWLFILCFFSILAHSGEAEGRREGEMRRKEEGVKGRGGGRREVGRGGSGRGGGRGEAKVEGRVECQRDGRKRW